MPVPSKTQEDLYRQSDSLVYALAYEEKGWNPTPINPGTKAARLKDWETRRLSRAEIEVEFRPDDNVGLVLGESSGNLVLVDLDSVTAVEAGDRFLSDTGLVGGRAKKPKSHRFYHCETLPKNKQFKSPRLKKVHVEILADKKQAAVAPSLLDDGERKAWDSFDEPATIPGDDLTEQVTRLAVHCELAAIWPDYGRHEAALALAGGLLRTGWSESEVIAEIESLCQDTVDNRREIPNLVQDTATKLENEVPGVTGWPTLAKLTGEKASIDAILDWLGVADVDLDDDRPAVRVYDGDLDKLSDQSWAALAIGNDPPTVFRRSNRPVRIERIDDSDTVIIQDLNDVRLRYHLSAAIRFYQWRQDRVTKQTVQAPAKVSLDVVRNMLAYEETPLPVLNRVVTVPVFSPSGTLQTEPGYHPDARVYYEPPKGLTIPPVSERPTPAEVATAKHWLLDELLGEFPFVGEADKAHAVALALQPFVRDLINGFTPFHLFEAAKQGTGKGLLVRVLTAISTGGGGVSPTPMSGSEEEVRKMLFAKLLEGPTFILLDNLSGTVSSDALAVALTSPTYSDRKLSVSETPHVQVRCGWVGTANNASLSSDLTRRTIRSRMVADVENPHLREFAKSDLFGWSIEHRAELVWSILTLTQAWLAAGRPEGRQMLGSYESWAKVIGGILDVAGIPGFLSNLSEFYDDANTQGASWKDFVGAWWEQYGPEPQSATTLLRVAEAANFPFTGWKDDDKKRELGVELKAQKDNVYAGCAIRQGKDRRTKANNYRLEPKNGQVWEGPPTLLPDEAVSDNPAGTRNPWDFTP